MPGANHPYPRLDVARYLVINRDHQSLRFNSRTPIRVNTSEVNPTALVVETCAWHVCGFQAKIDELERMLGASEEQLDEMERQRKSRLEALSSTASQVQLRYSIRSAQSTPAQQQCCAETFYV